MRLALLYIIFYLAYASAVKISLSMNGEEVLYSAKPQQVKIDDSLEFSVKILEEGFSRPKQAMVEFSEPHSEPHYFALLPKKGSLYVYLDLSKDFEFPCHSILEGLGQVQYDVTIYLSDEKWAKPVDWHLGKIAIPVKFTKATQKKCEQSEELQWHSRPEFSHVFRPPAARAPTVVAYAFVGILVSIPNIILLAVIRSVFTTKEGSSSSRSGTTTSWVGLSFREFLFVSVLVGLLAVIVLYWLDCFRLFPALFLLTSVGLVACILRPKDTKGESGGGSTTSTTTSEKKTN